METTAESAKIRLAPDRQFQITLRADQIQLLLDVIREAHFKGSQASMVHGLLTAIQDPILREAHGGIVGTNPQEESHE